MKTFFAGALVLTLVGAAGCTSSSTEGPQGTAPATSEKPAPTVVKKPIAGEASGTFNLSVPFESIELRQGEEKDMELGINRGEDFGEEVEIEVSGLPAGVTVENSEPVIAHGAEGVTLKLKATSDAALGDFTAEVTGRTLSSGADFSKDFKLSVAPK